MKNRPWHEEAELSPRKSWSKATVAAVYLKCDGRCVKCGSKGDLDIDHEIPLALGGSNDDGNLQLLCRGGCHTEKTKGDIGKIAKVRRLRKKELEPRPMGKIKSRGFDKTIKRKLQSRGFQKRVKTK